MVAEGSEEIYNIIRNIGKYSKASAARIQLYIIVSALNLNHEIDSLYYPSFSISEDNIEDSHKVCEIMIDNTKYSAFVDIDYCEHVEGIGNMINFCDFNGYVFGCYSEDCAIYLGLKFYDLILTAMYGDDSTFKIL